MAVGLVHTLVIQSKPTWGGPGVPADSEKEDVTCEQMLKKIDFSGNHEGQGRGGTPAPPGSEPAGRVSPQRAGVPVATPSHLPTRGLSHPHICPQRLRPPACIDMPQEAYSPSLASALLPRQPGPSCQILAYGMRRQNSAQCPVPCQWGRLPGGPHGVKPGPLVPLSLGLGRTHSATHLHPIL